MAHSCMPLERVNCSIHGTYCVFSDLTVSLREASNVALSDIYVSISTIPVIGYALGTLVEASILHQAASEVSHTDPIHVTAHFLRATNAGTGEVQIKLVKTGRTFTNLHAQLVQNVRAFPLSSTVFP